MSQHLPAAAEPHTSDAPFRFIARRNNSFPLTANLALFGSIAAVMLVIALGFAMAGAWPIFLFSGLELTLVYLAIRHMSKHAQDYESISVHDDKLVVVIKSKDMQRCVEFNPYWVQVVGGASHGVRDGALILRSHGKDVAFGVHLTGEQRVELAHRLKHQLRIRRHPDCERAQLTP
ncbi:MAG TPA: DUF2244 domain-containing protein [Burkholderiales bacterium]|nr:DUF2244 domain-containing protein [Burkholderiales bacterium]